MLRVSRSVSPVSASCLWAESSHWTSSTSQSPLTHLIQPSTCPTSASSHASSVTRSGMDGFSPVLSTAVQRKTPPRGLEHNHEPGSKSHTVLNNNKKHLDPLHTAGCNKYLLSSVTSQSVCFFLLLHRTVLLLSKNY